MSRLHAALRRLTLAFFAATAAASSQATSFSDLWWEPDESGWGINLIQQEDTIFATLFVYGSDERPAWYVAPATRRAGAAYTGPLYSTRGPWFGGPFNPSNVQSDPVGSLTFAPSGTMRGTLTYSVSGVSVTKSIERQTWRPISLAGRYVGGVDLKNDSACGAPSELLAPNVLILSLAETPDGSGTSGTLQMIVADVTGASFVYNGRYEQHGSMHESEGSVAVEGGGSVTASVKDISRDGNTLRGELRMQTANGCTMRFRFAGVRDE